MCKTIIVGSNSYIGNYLIQKLEHEDIQFICLSPEPVGSEIKLDLLNVDEFNFEIISPNDTILFLAAISSPDVCQNSFNLSFRINVTGTIRFIEKALNIGAKVLFFSSDTVYGDLNGKNSEEIHPFKPIGEYAFMKLSVENYFKDNMNLKIFRLSYVFSWHDKFMKYLHHCRQNNLYAEIYHPFTRRMIYIEDLTKGVISAIKNWTKIDKSIFNFCGADYYSRLDIAKYYSEHIFPVKYKVIKPHDSFYKARPEIINVSTVNTTNILLDSFTKIEDAILIEKKIHY